MRPTIHPALRPRRFDPMLFASVAATLIFASSILTMYVLIRSTLP